MLEIFSKKYHVFALDLKNLENFYKNKEFFKNFANNVYKCIWENKKKISFFFFFYIK